MHHARAVGAALLLLFVCSDGHIAFGWGAEGHEAICEIAYQELVPKARSAVDALMAHEADQRFRTFRQSCGWPDHDGQLQQARRPDHYINIPRHWTAIWYQRCYQTRECLFTALTDDEALLRSTWASTREKLVALKFFGHWVGDIHQPLHVSYQDDKGGNHILLQEGMGCKHTLHDVWDNCIPEDLMTATEGANDREQFGKILHSQITTEHRQAWLTALKDAGCWACQPVLQKHAIPQGGQACSPGAT